jgi:hypothetical protein
MRNDNRMQTLLEQDDLNYETMKHSNIHYPGNGGGEPHPRPGDGEGGGAPRRRWPLPDVSQP